MTPSVSSEQFIKAPPAQVYLSFTRSLILSQWLCDFATVTPRPGGRMYLWWTGDFYSAGEYIALEENKSLKFKWHARDEPAPSEVSVSLSAEEGGTRVVLSHGVPEGEEWQERAQGFKTEWDSTLPNLASLLETGLDRRIYDRPMLGIQINDFNAEIAHANSIPVSEGIRLAEAVEGMGAHAAGLTAGDVIIEFNGKPITNDFGTLPLAMQGKKGGDDVQVVFYRGPQKHTVTMTLSKRPVPEVPAEPGELARQVQEKYDQGFTLLEDVFDGVSENDAAHSPAPGEWSAVQTLAHLVHSERFQISNLGDLVTGYQSIADDFGGNPITHIDATVTAFGGVPGLLAEMKRLSVEMVNLAASLPPDFLAWKCNYLNLGNALLNGMFPHTQSHIEQIRNAIASAKKK
jgi:uncharacterized protein YndB with AHSA1/START domain